MKKPNQQVRHQKSAYPRAASFPNQDIVFRVRDRAVRDLMDAYRVGVTECDLYMEDTQEFPTNQAIVDRLLTAAQSLTTDTSEHGRIIRTAFSYYQWAMENIPQKNPVILSRFSVEMAWDFCYRINLSADLTYHWPTRWWSKYGYANGKKQLFQSWLPKTIDYHPPLPLSKKQLDSLIDNTNQYGDEEVQQVNLVDAFCGLQPTYLWSFDAIRPPVQAIRTAAELIEQELVGDLSNPLREFSRTHLNVLALELGHSAASQALSVFLPGFTITTSSLVYQGTQYSHRPEKFDAVVMNIPNAAAMVFTRFILDRHRSEPVWPLHHHELHRFWEWPTNDPGCHLPFLMTIAMTKLADDGLLVIMGDIESGQLHRAADIVRQDNSLVPLRIAGNDRPIQFQYKSKPWGLYDSIRPTGRLIDAWRRKP